jgi:deazaflavin-dependent oxidoreductase (nitroreductase family)
MPSSTPSGSLLSIRRFEVHDGARAVTDVRDSWLRLVEKYVLNPPLRLLFQLGLAPRSFALIETVGRRTGRRRLTPVGNGLDGETFWLVAERGVRAGYTKNLLTAPRVRVKVGRRWYRGTAHLVAGDDAWNRRRSIDRANGLMGRLDGMAFRTAATSPCTIRIDLEETSPVSR